MQNAVVTYADFADAVKGYLQEEKELIERNTDILAKEVADETAKYIKANAPKRTGKYKKSIKVTTEGKGFLIHSRKKPYLLTNALEYGHETNRKHGRYGKKAKTRAYPHWSKAQVYAEKRINEKVKELLG